MIKFLRIITLIFFFLALLPSLEASASTSLVIVPKSVNMGSVKANNYEAGYMEKVRANTILVKDTTQAWKLMIKTNDYDMGVIGNYTKPISDFYWKAIGDTATQLTYTNITNFDIEVARGPSTTSYKTIYLDYRIILAWENDIPGNYNITVTYTLTTQ